MYKRICEICGEEFDSKSPIKRICYKDHIKVCPDCGKKVIWNSPQPFTGCKKCNQKRAVVLRKQTMLQRYGGETTLQSPMLKAKAQDTILDRYGVDNVGKSAEVVDKRKATCLSKYGVENPMQDKDIAKKSVDIRKENIEAITEKVKETMLSKYGVTNAMFVPEFVDKIADTMTARYGVKSAIMVPEFKQKMIDTNRERYGADYYISTVNDDGSPYHKISNRNLKIGTLLTASGYTVSYEYPISGFSYDLYVSELNLLIEIDPSYTHNAFGNHWRESGLPMMYHVEKTAVAEAAGFRCIHIFDWDDIQKIISILNSSNHIYARTCEIREVDVQTANAFIEQNHLQGSCRGTVISVGLYRADELLQIMTFGKPRYNSKFDWELLRLCTKQGITVVGGASKLFAFAVKQYDLHNIISYCDRSKFTGTVYEKIGMKLDHTSIPNVHWSRKKEHISGSLLRQRGFDQLFGTNYGKGTSNEVLMLQAGWLPVYDCGQDVYIYDTEYKATDPDAPPIDYKSLVIHRKRFEERICKFCGKSFVPNSNNQIYCDGPHYRNCPICGKQYLETNKDKLKRPPTTCSIECRKKKTMQVCIKKYGVTAPGCISHKRIKHKEEAE